MKVKEVKFIECKYCGTKKAMKNYNQTFCSDECRNDFHNDIKAEAMQLYRTSKQGDANVRQSI